MAKFTNEVVIEKIAKLLQDNEVVEITRERGVEEIGIGPWMEFNYDGTGSITLNFRKKEEPLKVGDYVRVVKSGEAMMGFSDGDIVLVTSTECTGRHKYQVRKGGVCGYAHAKINIVRATDEEVADAKEKLAAAKAQAEAKREADRWEKIGRKPGEYKKGDIVKYDDGEFAEVIGMEDGAIRVQTQSAGICTEDIEDITLITPVESRFDLAMDGDQDDAK